MNKLEVGMYVKTKTFTTSKIGKLEKIDNICITDNGAVDINQIVKSSYNIIDLIEVGDYVNGEKVVAIHKHYVWNEEDIGTALETEHEYTAILNEDIKSIVTKEQFEQMKYEVE